MCSMQYATGGQAWNQVQGQPSVPEYGQFLVCSVLGLDSAGSCIRRIIYADERYRLLRTAHMVVLHGDTREALFDTILVWLQGIGSNNPLRPMK